MLSKVKAVFSIPDVLQQGKMVANPESWKRGQITTSVLVGLIGTLITMAKVFGYELPITDEQLITICSGVMAVYGVFFNSIATVASTNKIGFKPSNND